MVKCKESKQRKPIIVLICEGRNQTESKYFNHFKIRENPYVLKLVPSEATDPISMAKKAYNYIKENQLTSSLGDKVFCIVDLDLSDTQYEKVQTALKKNNKKCEINFVLSNPCFEIWLLYYFTKCPKKESSSQKVKEQLKKYVSNYKESFDIVKECNLKEKLDDAIKNYKNHNKNDFSEKIIDKNPYTEIPQLIEMLLSYGK